MTIRRSDIVDAGTPGIYHCVSRCVRRESLLDDPARRQWILQRLKFLANWMAVDVISYAVMRNHIHLLLAIRPDLVHGWSDREVAERRVALLRNQRVRRQRGIPPNAPPTTQEVEAILSSSSGIARARVELCSLSFFHRLVKEPCARLWNRQDRVTGHFWEGRFKSPRVLDVEGLLQVARYIELNQVHAGVADSAHSSEWTSASLQWKRMVECAREVVQQQGENLTPEQLATRLAEEAWRPAIPCRAVIGSPRSESSASTVDDLRIKQAVEWAGATLERHDPSGGLVWHIENLDRSGRFARPDKSGRIPSHSPSPILVGLVTALRDRGGTPLPSSTPAHESGCPTRDFAERCIIALCEARCPDDRSTQGALSRSIAVSRGSCYGGPDSAAREARRRGLERVWVGLVQGGDDLRVA